MILYKNCHERMELPYIADNNTTPQLCSLRIPRTVPFFNL